MSYIARANYDPDEPEIVGPHDTLEELAEDMVLGYLRTAHGLIESEGHRLHRLVDVCRQIASEGQLVVAAVDAMQAWDFDSGPLLDDPWEVHRT